MSALGIIINTDSSTPWQRIDAAGNPIDPTPGDFDAHPIFGGLIDDEIDGQHMVIVPAFHYRHGLVESGPQAGKPAIWVSDTPDDGFALYPAFRHDNADLARFWLGKYQGTPDGTDKMGSQPGHVPLGSINFPAMQARAAARGDGWMMWSIYQLAAIQTLALIEHGTPNLRSIMGDGYVDGDGLRPVDDATVVQAAYRGITGLWGNAWQMVDGLQTDRDRRYRVWDKHGRRDFIDTGARAPGNGWFGQRHTSSDYDVDLAALFLPKATSDDATFEGYTWAYSNAVAYHGGSWDLGGDAGLFCLIVGSDARDADSGVGSRLAKV